jgi:hypothetical protein
MTEDSTPPGESGSGISTPVVVALLSLAGVLGASLLTNWDRIFSTRKPAAPIAAGGVASTSPASQPVPTSNASAPASPVGGSTSGAQSPVVNSGGGSVTINIAPPAAPPASASPAPPDISARLLGAWITPLAQNPYSARDRFRLQLEFERFGSRLVGTATDIPEGSARGHSREMLDLALDGRSASFHTAGTVLSGSTEVPYQTHYRLELDGSTLRITRRNTVASGGETERFVAERTASSDRNAEGSPPPAQAR